MRAKRSIITISVCAAVLVAAVLWPPKRTALPRSKLSDGTEFRVIQVRFTPNASEEQEHNIGGAPSVFFWLWRHLPSSLQSRVPYPDTGIGYTASQYPAISIWWARVDPASGSPLPSPTANVVMFLDSGEHSSLPYRSDGAPKAPHYRQIWVHEPTNSSKPERCS